MPPKKNKENRATTSSTRTQGEVHRSSPSQRDQEDTVITLAAEPTPDVSDDLLKTKTMLHEFLKSSKLEEWIQSGEWTASDVNAYYLITRADVLIYAPHLEDPHWSITPRKLTEGKNGGMPVLRLPNVIPDNGPAEALKVLETLLLAGRKAATRINATIYKSTKDIKTVEHNIALVLGSLRARYFGSVAKRLKQCTEAVKGLESGQFGPANVLSGKGKIFETAQFFVQWGGKTSEDVTRPKMAGEYDDVWKNKEPEKPYGDTLLEKCQTLGDRAFSLAAVELAALFAETNVATIIPKEYLFDHTRAGLYYKFKYVKLQKEPSVPANQAEHQLESISKPFIVLPRPLSQRHLVSRIFS